jgi:hypothetical protein
MKYFFWIAFAVFLAASIPHVAYFFASFEPSQGPEGVWWWAVSYAIAISIDVTVYLLSWTAFQRYRRYRTAKAVWQHWLLIVMCTVFSWAVNWAYAKQFHSTTMLSAAESTAPWLTSIFPFMASAFPLLGIVYTMMAETISETSAEDKQGKEQELVALSELARQAQLPMATLRRALNSGTRLNAAGLLAAVNRGSAKSEPAASQTITETETGDGSDASEVDANRPITGQVTSIKTITKDVPEKTERTTAGQNAAAHLTVLSNDGNPDKLQMTIEALRANPDMTDEALAAYLSLKRPASARFWRLKAIEILTMPGREQTGKTPAVQGGWSVPATPVAAANGSNGKF